MHKYCPLYVLPWLLWFGIKLLPLATKPSSQSRKPVSTAMNVPSRSSMRTPNADGVRSSQQQQLPTPPDSSIRPRPGDDSRGNLTSSNDAQGTQVEHDRPGQPGGSPRRYTTYPEIVDPQNPQPAPYQSNGRRRRRTQAELLMFHALAWLGYGEAVPNVSVVTGGPLMDGDIPTHGTWDLDAKHDGGDVDEDLADRVARSLTIATNRKAGEHQDGLKRGSA